ncbi:hypothetical protein [Streptomyces pseudovenezuelae]|uniref:Uncharacterized protein n=1 Tax=Streptomyces pseudovenezuelae TaxID=67350 RepID=A0ABT6LQB1_9ACTN|nr:hypothetical protein [Streptomyces pseudovenezuelae]MDH6218510.1 hypothetical protein [Streptomyces pseudovenezuelae]
MSGWWAYLEERTRQEVDANVLCDRRLLAVKAVWEALRPLGLGLIEAERVVHGRYEFLGDRVRRAQPDPLDVASLAARAAAHPGRVAAIEALWDGDTVHDWFVVLVAILNNPSGPSGEGHLATVYHRPDGTSPGTAAAEAGHALAQHLGVPFHFASPDVPDDEAPRWRAVQGRAGVPDQG